MKSKRKKDFESKERDRLIRMLNEVSNNYKALRLEMNTKETMLAEKNREIELLNKEITAIRAEYEKNMELAKKSRAACDEARKRYLDLTKSYEKEMSAWMKAVRSTAV